MMDEGQHRSTCSSVDQADINPSYVNGVLNQIYSQSSVKLVSVIVHSTAFP